MFMIGTLDNHDISFLLGFVTKYFLLKIFSGTTPYDMTASVKSPSGVTEVCDVVSLDDSHYSIKFVPKEMGVHTVSVKHKDMHIPGESLYSSEVSILPLASLGFLMFVYRLYITFSCILIWQDLRSIIFSLHYFFKLLQLRNNYKGIPVFTAGPNFSYLVLIESDLKKKKWLKSNRSGLGKCKGGFVLVTNHPSEHQKQAFKEILPWLNSFFNAGFSQKIGKKKH